VPQELAMVVCAVRYEPVSDDNSLLTGKLTGNFAISGLLDTLSERKSAALQRFFVEFLTEKTGKNS
jgi:hypothetical protein